jgi:hypothetical protein
VATRECHEWTASGLGKATAIPQQSNPDAPYFLVDHLLVFTQGRLNPSDEHAMLL